MIRIAPLLAMATAIAIGSLIGCSPAAGAPVLVRGTVVDESGAPVAETQVILDAFDGGGAPGGPEHFTASVATLADGTFEFRLAPPRGLQELAANNGGMLGFGLGAQVHPNVFARSAFERHVLGGEWAGEPPVVVVRPMEVAP